MAVPLPFGPISHQNSLVSKPGHMNTALADQSATETFISHSHSPGDNVTATTVDVDVAALS